jgi:peptidoglycan/LPS O-acetylase OafA/YrhL
MTESGFRLDIQGLRGFALVLVLATHAELPSTEGGFVGLDVFYVLSGFLITGLLLQEMRRTGRVSLLKFYARRARRLLPLAVTVLGAIFVGSILLFGPVRAYDVAGDMLAATLYVANWRFMAQETEYFQFDDSEVSPVQHYWSLSVEEQFYLVWPLVILALLWLARHRIGSPRALLWTVLVPITAASFAYGVWFSGVDPQASYFSTLGRVWEIGVGCLLALALPVGLRMPRLLSGVLTAGGLAALVWATTAFTGLTPYPGWSALVPVLGSAAVIVAGTATKVSAPIRLLSTAPLQYLGKISYAWYLWHWPALVFATAAAGTTLTPLQKTVVTLAAGVPTVVTHYMIEERFRRSKNLARRPRRALAVGFACSALAVVLAVSLGAMQPVVPTASADEAPGARAVDRGQRLQRSAKKVRPNPRRVKEDYGRAFTDECHLKGTKRTESPGDTCIYGNPDSDKVVVNMGDSHGLMYAPTGIRLAERRNWRLINLTRSGCTAADVDYRPPCNEWRENSLQRIEQEQPSLIMISNGTDDDERYRLKRDGEKLTRDQSQGMLRRGWRRTLKRLRATGAKVVVIRDMPRAYKGIVDCVAENLKRLVKCAFRPRRPSSRAFDAKGARNLKRVRVVDPRKVLCPRQSDHRRLCPAVIGNVIVYRNDNHLSATFAQSLAPWLAKKMPKVRARTR